MTKSKFKLQLSETCQERDMALLNATQIENAEFNATKQRIKQRMALASELQDKQQTLNGQLSKNKKKEHIKDNEMVKHKKAL